MKLGIINQDTNNFKRGTKVEILNEYNDTTVIGNWVYVLRIIDERKNKYINTNYNDEENFEMQYDSIQLITKYKVDEI